MDLESEIYSFEQARDIAKSRANKTEEAKLVANYLWQREAVLFDSHYQLTEKTKSPIYINSRAVIGDTKIRGYVISELTKFVNQIVDKYSREEQKRLVLLGGATAGMPFCSRVGSQGTHQTFPEAYIRRKLKSNKKEYKIEGLRDDELAGKLYLLFEDTIKDGKTKLDFIAEVKRRGGKITDCVVVADRMQGGREALRAAGVNLHSLTDIYSILLMALSDYNTACGINRITKDKFAEIVWYIDHEKEWHAQHGYAFKELETVIQL